MGKWFFTRDNNSMVAKMTPETDEVRPKTHTFRDFSFTRVADKFRFFECGKFRFSALFTQMGNIQNVEPTDAEDAENLLLFYTPSSQAYYNLVSLYDTPGDLPVLFDAATIHSISILCLTGTLTIEIDTEQTVMTAGQKIDIEATTLIAMGITLVSTTGTFTVTTIS